ncbi:MAG TPA: hypothetical protein VK742_08270 [Candidatus Sulfotelmatobacter sp.]|jgi:hypothetical protein|nr:hypothetical protein [Candidatus Sulfotelmatobacter sp.]
MILNVESKHGWEIILVHHRCGVCGLFWAVEKSELFAVAAGFVICPRCAIQAVEDEKKRNAKLWRQLQAQKAATTRAKGGAS